MVTGTKGEVASMNRAMNVMIWLGRGVRCGYSDHNFPAGNTCTVNADTIVFIP